ncbi:MAG: hypothetical protein AVDCRST_MAG27-576 [uncultured Craurococcus sp.]|uniref:Uncharacterized protein n=1 Tax=uncultured Craurococcus sp. TaxID=1135998 RepID=A0A6J4HMB6_9PROT|nr:MAG: hypothetical protein AVDCRST_MAG27-576 [uncultured Craurococcus sp.]
MPEQDWIAAAGFERRGAGWFGHILTRDTVPHLPKVIPNPACRPPGGHRLRRDRGPRSNPESHPIRS